jgi:hypothetical protein
MNALAQFKATIRLLLIPSALAYLSLAPEARSVVPAPDGGYPGGNTAEGQDALLSLTTGSYNSAVGFFSLRTVTAGSFNTAIGAGTLFGNTADGNTASGAGALLSNTTGSQNTATGAFALIYNSVGQSNTANGFDALFSNTDGDGNTALGTSALFSNTTGSGNTAVGAGALAGLSAGTGNTAVGVNANTSGLNLDDNTIVGANAQGAFQTTVIGANASGGIMQNTVVGFQANGGDTGNTVMGAFAGSNLGFAFNVICIGADGQNVDNSCYIGNIWNQPGGSQAVYVNSDGKLGFQTSSRRFKDEVKPIKRASEVIYELKPVSFRYKPGIEPARPRGFGLIAEDVQKVNPDLVIRDAEGKPASVRYDAVNAMLLNEFLKARRQIDAQQKQIERLTAGLQRVSAQLELNKPAPQTVRNND